MSVERDASEDFSTYRTWDWMPQTTPRVSASPDIAPALEVRLARLIEESFEARGMRRTEPPADFYVRYHLAVQRRIESVEQPMAQYFLSSYSNTTSYYIEGTESVERRMDDIRLTIETAAAGGRTTWQALLERSVEVPTALPLESSVAELLDRFPSAATEPN